MVNEIPMVIPKGAVFVKKFYKHISYIEADNIKEYSEGIIKIISNYSKFLEISKTFNTPIELDLNVLIGSL